MAPMFFLFIKKNKFWLLYFPVILICVGSFLVIISSKGHFFGYPTHGFFISYDFMFNYTFFGRCIEFFIGIALALAFKEGWIKTDFKFFTYFGFIGIIFSVFLISSFKGNFDLGISHPAGKLVNNLVLPLIGIAPFFLGLLREKTIISSILGSPVFVLLGKSSYIFYLIHYGLFAYFLRDHISSNLVVFLVMNLISVVFYIALEEPMNKWIRRKFSSGSPGKSES
jgi:peptidoglycan/LPS O-acetylase OafA/YrhL